MGSERSMKDLYLVGGGGHCHSCIDVIEQEGAFRIRGIFDVKNNLSKSILGYKVIGVDDDLNKFIAPENYFLITVGQIRNFQKRADIFNRLLSAGANLPNIISPRAYVSKHVLFGKGNIVMHDVLINANVKIENNNIFNSKCLIEHDVVVESHCHISTAAIVNGNCRIASGVFVGSNAVIEQGREIPKEELVSAGSFYRGR